MSAKNYDQARQILSDKGSGAGDGCSVNMTFLHEGTERIFRNIEIGPASDGKTESELDIITAIQGQHLLHCNS